MSKQFHLSETIKGCCVANSFLCTIPFFAAQVRGKKTRSARVFRGAGVQDSVRMPLAAVPIGPDLGYFYIKNPPSLAVLLSWI